MKKHEKPPTLTRNATSRSTALITVPRPAPRRGAIATAVHMLAAVLLLPVRLPVLALMAAGRGVARAGAGAGRGVATLLMLPVRLVVGIARLVGMLIRAIARAVVFILRIPFVALRLLCRGSVGAVRGLAFAAAAVAVPLGALAWGAVRSVAAGISAVGRGLAIALAFLGRLAARGVAALFLGILSTLRSLAVGVFVCLLGTAKALLWILLLSFRALRIVAVATIRGVRSAALLLVDAVRTVASGLVALFLGTAALVRLAGRWSLRPARSLGAALATREPQRAAFLPLAVLAVFGGIEMLTPGFPFATVGLLLLAAFASLALMSRPTTMGGVLLAWGLAVACGWRAERVAVDSLTWIDMFVYLAFLAAVRSAYVAVRAFATDAPLAPRDAEQERAHRRASRAIGIVLAAECLGFAFWSLGTGVDAPVIFGELMLVGAGATLAWVVRSGQYVRTAQAVLTLGAIGSIVLAIAAQLSAFAAGRTFTVTSLGAALLLLLVTGALVVVVHARLIDADHGA